MVELYVIPSTEIDMVIFGKENQAIVEGFNISLIFSQHRDYGGFVSLEHSGDQEFADLLNLDTTNFGMRLKRIFEDKDFIIPERVKRGCVTVENELFRRINLAHYMYLIEEMGHGEIIKLESAKEFLEDGSHLLNACTEIHFKSLKPYALVASIACAIKENWTKLGKDAALFGIKHAEQLPEVSEYMNQYLQKGF